MLKVFIILIFSSPGLSLMCENDENFNRYKPSANSVEPSCSAHKNSNPYCAALQGILINLPIELQGNESIIKICFNKTKCTTLYVEHDLKFEKKTNAKNNCENEFYDETICGLSIQELYNEKSKKSAIAAVVGSSKAKEYVTIKNFLSRGHLAPKGDFQSPQSQNATYNYINIVPQWSLFNSGNWNTLEQKLRTRIKKRELKVYTGTWEILKLKDSSGIGREIYLEPSSKKIPVPLWFYKVVREPSTNRATAFLGLNNPHVTLAEAKNLAFCTDVCYGNSYFSWVKWKSNEIKLGYSICCDVNDFNKTVKHLPNFTVGELFY